MARKGRRGGEAVARKYGIEYMRELGRRGGKTTKARHGREHLSRAGRAGHQAQVKRYFEGDEEKFRHWFTEAGLAAQDPMPANGAFPPARRFPYGDNPPGKLTWQQWDDIWDDHFEFEKGGIV
jgi:general stress protein YciG